jgi:hypothetical protein
MNAVESVMAVCGSSIPLAFATAVRVRYVNAAIPLAAQRLNRARSVSSSILCQWDRLRCSGETGTDGTSGRPVCACTANV